MALSARNRRKHLKKAVTLLPPDGAQPLDYALGGAGQLPPRLLSLALLGGWVVLTVLLSVVLQSIVVVGFLPMLVLFFLLNKPRGVLLTDRGVALLKCGILNGRPTDLISVDSVEALQRRAETRGGSTKIDVAGRPVWVRDKDLAAMSQLVRS
jgi:hypothetical protein